LESKVISAPSTPIVSANRDGNSKDRHSLNNISKSKELFIDDNGCTSNGNGTSKKED